MKTTFLSNCVLAVAATCAISMTSCTPPPKAPPHPAASEDDHEGHDHSEAGHDEHGHAEHVAPNGGHLIELGRDHAYHAELTDDHSTDTVTIYMLDGDLKTMPTQQTSVQLVLTADGKTESFELKGDGSEFSASSSEMLEMLEADGATGKLRVTIDGKPMTGSFEHEEHDHGHNH